MGFFQSRGNFHWEQVSGRFAFHVIHAGKGIMKANGQEWEVSAGDLFLFWPNMHIIYYDKTGFPWRYTWFNIEGPKAEEAIRATGLNPENPRLDVSGTRSFQDWLKKTASSFKTSHYTPLFPATSAWECLGLLEGMMQEDPKQAPTSLELAEQVRQLLDVQPLQILSVGQLAKELKVDRSTIFRSFKKRFGVSAKEYLSSRQLAQSSQLLARSAMSVKEIAAACGFRNHCHFTRRFRREFGLSPLAWRKEKKAHEPRR